MKITAFLLTVVCMLFVVAFNVDAERDLADITGLAAKDDGRGEMQVGVIVASDQNNTLCPLLQKTLDQAIAGVCASESCKKCRIKPMLRCVQPELQTVLNEAKALTEKNGVTLLIGPFNPTLAQSFADYAESASVPVFLTDNTGFSVKTLPGHWVFSLAFDPVHEFKAFLKTMGPNLERVLVLLEDTPEAREAEVFLRGYATETGLKNLFFFFEPAAGQSGLNVNDTSHDKDAVVKIPSVYKAIRGFEARTAQQHGNLQKTAVVSFLPSRVLFAAIPEDANIRSILFMPSSQLDSGLLDRYGGRFRLMASLPPVAVAANLPQEHPCAMAVMKFSLAMEDDTAEHDLMQLSYSAVLWDAVRLVGEALHQECSLPSNKWGTDKERNWFFEAIEGLQQTLTGVSGRFGFRKGAHKKSVVETNVLAEWKENAWCPVTVTAGAEGLIMPSLP
ncbi:MAG: hypothetical protein ABWK15_02080 [Dissulfuribacterales bacterium]